MKVHTAYWYAFAASGYAAVGHAFLSESRWFLLPLVIWLVACLVAVVYGREVRDV